MDLIVIDIVKMAISVVKKINDLVYGLLVLVVIISVSCSAEKNTDRLKIDVKAGEPIYTTYAASLESSEYIIDQAYEFIYDNMEEPLLFSSSAGGSIGFGFIYDSIYIDSPGEMYSTPVLKYSFPDMCVFEFEPVKDIFCMGQFVVSSSTSVITELELFNRSEEEKQISLVSYIESSESFFSNVDCDTGRFSFISEKYPDNWTLSHDLPYFDSLLNIFVFSPDAADMEVCMTDTNDLRQLGKDCINSPALVANKLWFKKILDLSPGESKKVRFVRKTGSYRGDPEKLITETGRLMKIDLTAWFDKNVELFSGVLPFLSSSREQNLLILSSFNMMRQQMYPPEGKSSFNYYVFSREPVWGWGHGGQVFHESIAMLAYALLFPESAMNSQRVYSERQYDNGYINYRTGSYLDEIIEYNGELTSSAPWYSWLNWEIYMMTGDRDFLEEMYVSSKKFYNFYVSTRDKDGDGLCEWGGHAVLESVRDGLVAVWDEVGWPSEFEGVDINSMLVKEAKSLEQMALELGLSGEALQWKEDYSRRTELINKVCWDEIDGFYFNADKRDNDFSYKKNNDLKREEIIGFLPLWAGIASEEQASELVDKLTDTAKFWREYGVPSLSASDSYYNDKGYWNGPVWVEWNYLVVRGLLDYGYEEEAQELVKRVSAIMIKRLAEDHNLWEFYSPDDNWGGYHKTYIWAGIIVRMLLDTGLIDKKQELMISADKVLD